MNNYHDGGESILEAFRNLDVDYVISSPGSEWPPLWEALARQKRDGTAGPIYMDCGHEILAVTMASAYTHITGRMQAVLILPEQRRVHLAGGPAERKVVREGPAAGRTYIGGDPDSFERSPTLRRQIEA